MWFSVLLGVEPCILCVSHVSFLSGLAYWFHRTCHSRACSRTRFKTARPRLLRAKWQPWHHLLGVTQLSPGLSSTARPVLWVFLAVRLLGLDIACSGLRHPSCPVHLSVAWHIIHTQNNFQLMVYKQLVLHLNYLLHLLECKPHEIDSSCLKNTALQQYRLACRAQLVLNERVNKH